MAQQSCVMVPWRIFASCISSGSMIDIQSVTAEIRRRKKRRTNYRTKI